MRRYLAWACLGALLLPVAGSAQAPPAYDGTYMFTRIRYGSSFGRGGGSWAHDYPRADQHLPRILAELTTMRPTIDDTRVLDLEDSALFHHPVIYVSEPGFWTVTERGAAQLRAHLLKGGFVIFDDFEGEAQWGNMARQMQHVLPEHRWVEIDVTHPIFHSFFDMKRIDFPHPLVDVIPSYFALFDDNDPAARIIALANYNNDLAEYWEWSATGLFPVDTTNEAYKLGVNYIIYAMTH
ncbi:MAG: DUF4159 domain-containing protein [Acidobacteriota bacterium]